jgi:hypothetical protein
MARLEKKVIVQKQLFCLSRDMFPDAVGDSCLSRFFLNQKNMMFTLW